MKKLFFDDQSHIADEFVIFDDHTNQLARLAFHKINAYKLSLQNQAFCMSRNELQDLIKATLLNYTHPCTILQLVNYFNDCSEN